MVDIIQDRRSPLANEAALLANASTTDALRILLIETDPSSHHELDRKLSLHGFDVHKPGGDGCSLTGAPDINFDAAVIVVGSNRIRNRTSGIDILASLRRQGANLPLLFVTGQAASVDDYRSVGDRAADFATSRESSVLAERLKNVIQAFKNTGALQRTGAIDCGQLRLRADVNRAYWRDVDLDLTVGEYRNRAFARLECGPRAELPCHL